MDRRYFAARQRNALGIATELIGPVTVDEFIDKNPNLELLASFADLAEARRYFISDTIFTKVTDYGRIR